MRAGRAVEEPGDVGGARRVAAEQAVASQRAELPGLHDGVGGQRSDRVGVATSRAGCAGREAIEEGLQARVSDPHLGEQIAQSLAIRGGERPDGVERSQDEPLFLGAQVHIQDGHRGLVAGQGQRYPGMPVHQVPRALVDQHLLHPADRVERARQGLLLASRMEAPVEWIGRQAFGGLTARADDAAAPLARGSAGSAGRSASSVRRRVSVVPSRLPVFLIPGAGALAPWRPVRAFIW